MITIKKIAEYRAEGTEKGLLEQRADLMNEMDSLLYNAKAETRALSGEENNRFKELVKSVEEIDATLKAIDEQRALETKKPPKGEDKKEDAEIRSFANYIRETRAGEQNLDKGSNGNIIPVTIANMIIKTVKDISPILSRATLFNVKGTLKIPVYGKSNTTHDIAVGYQTEFTEITADAGKFTSVDLSGYLVGALTLVSRSLLNNSDLNLVNFVVNEMANKIAEFIEKELLVGTGSNSCQGVCVGCTNIVTTASATAITADELITLQSSIKQAYQQDAYWTMNSTTFAAIKKLKDGNGRYLLQDNVSNEFPFMLLGKPVHLSDNMAGVAAGAKTIAYGDMSGLAVKFSEQIEIEILREKYSTQHALGIIAWLELDSKVMDNQRMAVLVQKSV